MIVDAAPMPEIILEEIPYRRGEAGLSLEKFLQKANVFRSRGDPPNVAVVWESPGPGLISSIL